MIISVQPSSLLPPSSLFPQFPRGSPVLQYKLELSKYFDWITYKVLLANFIHIPFALGQAILTLIAYYFNDWRRLQLCMAALTALTPDSPRWLFAKNKLEKATKLVQEGARWVE